MIAVHDLVRYCDRLLDAQRFRDAATNGLQVEGERIIRRLACAVSASQRTIEEAVAWDADALLVHHGLFWGDGVRSISGVVRRRLRPLLLHGLSLLAYHLPLDAHPELGNNAQLAFALGLEPVEPFAEVASTPIGSVVRTPQPWPLDQLVQAIMQVTDRQPTVLAGGPSIVERVAILSGSGASAVIEAAERHCHVLVTGEARETTMALARELGITVIAAGHEATERLGVQALAKHLSATFGLESTFLHDPNPI